MSIFAVIANSYMRASIEIIRNNKKEMSKMLEPSLPFDISNTHW